jgi:hypothetical protein
MGEDLLKFRCGAPRAMSKPLPPFIAKNIFKEHTANV